MSTTVSERARCKPVDARARFAADQRDCQETDASVAEGKKKIRNFRIYGQKKKNKEMENTVDGDKL